ncbi:hypothetical protein JCM7686_0587 [Paracoccus aminophilus JCM 7686]|uniref:DUF2927 domain-containing protein n=1 Tax=Paracoccus aminophilus JCM 7686 TaxID=1367847 RepID=S5YR15_PARAH|nr:hypothetical protein JCM7686_0587 [Paracoccus aminophilus JCM 7686]
MALPVRAGRLRPSLIAACLGVALVSACSDNPATTASAPITAAAPAPRPNTTALDKAALRRQRAADTKAANAAAQAAAATPASQNMRGYLANIQDALLQKGKMRTDDGSALGPLTVEQLVNNFVEVALYDEYSREGGKLIPRATPAPLRRWEVPVRMDITYGASVNPVQRARDRKDIAAYASRLQQVSGHPVSVTEGQGNFHVLILSEDERRAFGPRLNALVPGIPAADVQALADLAPQNYCTVFAYSRGKSAHYVQAVALIRSELPQKMRISCYHEELSQGLGLANDSPTARPSIFNDDEEFALLTRHDELLLKMLYDPRLRPGMSEAEARPVLTQIATELLAAEYQNTPALVATAAGAS